MSKEEIETHTVAAFKAFSDLLSEINGQRMVVVCVTAPEAGGHPGYMANAENGEDLLAFCAQHVEASTPKDYTFSGKLN